MYHGKDYFTNRKAVNYLRKTFSKNMIPRKEILAMGIKSSQLNRWEKEGKINAALVKNKKYYNSDKIKKLYLDDLKP